MTEEERIEAAARGIANSLGISFLKNKEAVTKYALAAVTAYLAGDVVVPIEPTWQMKVAGRETDNWPCQNIYGDFDDLQKDDASATIYRAMITASEAKG